ncbi:hypothetical protein Hanom_Chr03g00227161 [Helianthus anomalus]
MSSHYYILQSINHYQSFFIISKAAPRWLRDELVVSGDGGGGGGCFDFESINCHPLHVL